MEIMKLILKHCCTDKKKKAVIGPERVRLTQLSQLFLSSGLLLHKAFMLTPLRAGVARDRGPSKQEKESRLKEPRRFLGQGVPPMTKHHNNQVAC